MSAEDPHVPTDGRYRVLQAMNDAGVNFTWNELNGQHAFMRDEGSAGRYDGELALQVRKEPEGLGRRGWGWGGGLVVASVAALSCFS